MLKGQSLRASFRLRTANIHAIRKSNQDESSVNRFDKALSDVVKSATVETIQGLKSNGKLRLKKKAAILVSLCSVEGTPSLLYTVRSQDLRHQGGQVSFPGGQCDWTDRDVIHTALRETEEEIGVPQSSVDVWAVMPPLIDRLQTTSIYPVVGNLGNLSEEHLVLNKTEVSKVFTVPVEFLCHPENRSYTSFRTTHAAMASVYTLPVFLTKPKVWGLTAIATESLLSVMFRDLFPH